MEQKKQMKTGRFLSEQDREAMKRERMQRYRRKRRRKALAMLALLAGNGLLVYMVARGQIAPCYGTGFAAAVSVYFGYQLGV